jgi:hypothetical protein
MYFSQRSFRRPASARVGPAAIAVGRRVYVACSGDRRARVELTDDPSTTAATSLADGTEVEILAWRPLGSTGTRYRVATRDGREGWLSAGNLRSSQSAVPAAPAAPALPARASAPLRKRNAGVSKGGVRRA